MSEEVSYLSYVQAKKMVGNVIEEEHLHEANRRILTVYDLKGKELCWFDAEEVMAEIGIDPNKKIDSIKGEIIKSSIVWKNDEGKNSFSMTREVLSAVTTYYTSEQFEILKK